MVEILTRRAMPDFFEELPRGFKPLCVEERDMPRVIAGEDGRVRMKHRRTRVVVYLTPDQEPAAKPYDMGPANGRGGLSIPCSEVTEVAQVWEIFDWWTRVEEERAEREKWVKPQRTKAFLEGIADEADDRTKRALGLSTFGPGGKLQRESP